MRLYYPLIYLALLCSTWALTNLGRPHRSFSCQVYECMIRGIAVMRRRADSYVNATQILKVAGIDMALRTKILEKEIFPGEHEIVREGYGKYQGTWYAFNHYTTRLSSLTVSRIPLERGRDVANQFGVAGLLAPLFDHIPDHED